jgi:hypothetical protein
MENHNDYQFFEKEEELGFSVINVNNKTDNLNSQMNEKSEDIENYQPQN